MTYTREQLESLLALEDFHDIYAQADALRRETVGDVVHIRALLEFSNHCKRLCTYCGLNATDQKLSRFRMDPRDMIATAQEAARAGYRTIVLQSGEDPWYTPDRIGDIVKQIKKTGMAITLSCGEFPEDVYQYWRDCGADRYLLKHETSDPALYASLHPDSSLDARVACLRTLKKLGYETGGGFMIGLPRQTLSTIAGDLLLLQDIGCDMAGIGPFIPHPDTPLRDAPHGSTYQARCGIGAPAASKGQSSRYDRPRRVGRRAKGERLLLRCQRHHAQSDPKQPQKALPNLSGVFFRCGYPHRPA